MPQRTILRILRVDCVATAGALLYGGIVASVSKPFQFRGRWCIFYDGEDGRRKRKVISADRDEAFQIYEHNILPAIKAANQIALQSIMAAAVSVSSVRKLAKLRIADEQLRACVLNQLARVDKMCSMHKMPDVPPPSCTAADIRKMPKFSGVYFLWNGGIVDYVGESVNVPKRFTSHHVIAASDLVSFIPFEDHRRAEGFYIWLLNPPLNKSLKCERTKTLSGVLI